MKNKFSSYELNKVICNKKDLFQHTFPEFVFSGKSNVGKSTLINSILNTKNFARTSSVPGKTQNIFYYIINKKIFFVDLPGYGYAEVSKKTRNSWNKLIDYYLNTSENIRSIIQIIDFRHTPNENDLMMLDWIKNNNTDYRIIFSKTDKIKKTQISSHKKKMIKKTDISEDKCILFSSKTKNGLKEIRNYITSCVKI